MARVTFQEFTQLPILGNAGDASVPLALRAGDILIHHRHHGDQGWPTGLLDPFHSSIVDTEDGDTYLYDSMPGAGLRRKEFWDLHDDCVVFRPQGNQATQDAGVKAGDMAAILCSRRQTGYGNKHFLDGDGRAIGSVLASKTFTAGTRARLTKYKQRGYPKNAICSEYVILSYQMALTEGDTHFFDIDGKYSTPHNLESYMLHNRTNWLLAGKVIGAPYQIV